MAKKDLKKLGIDSKKLNIKPGKGSFYEKTKNRSGSKNIEDIRDPKAAKAHDTKETLKDKMLTDLHLPERKKAATSLQNSISNYNRGSKTNSRMTAPHKSERFFEPTTFKKPLKKGTAGKSNKSDKQVSK